MIPLLIDAAAAMDTVYQQQYYPAKDSLLAALADPSARRFVELNYGPWDRLDGDRPFVAGVGERPPGAELYPHDVTKDELERAAAASPSAGRALLGSYTVVRRDSAGALVAVPYHQAYREPIGPRRGQAPGGRLTHRSNTMSEGRGSRGRSGPRHPGVRPVDCVKMSVS